MDDQLEKFIVENREAFDDKQPSSAVWKKLSDRLGRRSFDWSAVWKVAAVLFLISTVYLMIDKNTNQPGSEFLWNEELVEAENYYVSLISERREALKGQLDKEDHEQFLREIDQLDLLYEELKATYQTNTSDERVMNALINNLQLRLDILNKQLAILQNIKNKNNEKDIPIEI